MPGTTFKVSPTKSSKLRKQSAKRRVSAKEELQNYAGQYLPRYLYFFQLKLNVIGREGTQGSRRKWCTLLSGKLRPQTPKNHCSIKVWLISHNCLQLLVHPVWPSFGQPSKLVFCGTNIYWMHFQICWLLLLDIGFEGESNTDSLALLPRLSGL